MLNKRDISERLKQARQALPGQVNPRQFALKAKGVDDSQYGKFEKGDGPLGSKKILELCSAWGINTDWVQTGKGPMFITQADERPAAQPPVVSLDYQAKYIAGLEEDKSWLKRMLETSLAEILKQTQLAGSRQKGTGEVVLRSLERLEGLKEDELVEQADKRIFQIDTEGRMHDNESVPRR